MWIDTLCIPCDERDDALRKLAIHKMAMVYVLAEQVLVIDRTVSNLSFRDSSDLDLAVRLLTSPWMTRCWTYQEACLARKFSFVLKDRMISPSWWSRAPHPVPADRCKTAIERRLKYECMSWFDNIPSIVNMAGGGEFDDFLELALELALEPVLQNWKDHVFISDAPVTSDAVPNPDSYETHMLRRVELARARRNRFDDVLQKSHTITMDQITNIWNSMAARDTSEKKDIHTILAALLGLSVKEVSQLEIEDRTKAILKTMSRLPLSIFYGPYADNTERAPGCDWIPLFPAGQLMWESSVTKLGRCETGQYMSWTDDWDLLVTCNFPLHKLALHFVLKPSASLVPEFFLGNNTPDEGWLKAILPNSFSATSRPLKVILIQRDGKPPLEKAAPHGILLSMRWGNDNWGFGACFVLQSPWEGEPSQPVVTYLAPLRFYRPDDDAMTSEEKLLPFIKADKPMGYDFCFKITTDAKDWPTLRYRRSSGELLVNGAVAGILRSIVNGAVWDYGILSLLAWDLIFHPPGFRIWHLYPLALMKCFQMGTLMLEMRGEWVEREVMMARCEAVGRTFDVENVTTDSENDTAQVRLFSKHVLQARALVGVLLIAGGAFTGRKVGRQLWRVGFTLLVEVSARAAAEIIWQISGLNRISSWADTLKQLQQQNIQESEEFYANRDTVRERTRALRPIMRRAFPWLFLEENVEPESK